MSNRMGRLDGNMCALRLASSDGSLFDPGGCHLPEACARAQKRTRMSRRCDSAGVRALSSDDLLKIFSLLSPRSLARSCLVCTAWNKIITSSLLWKSIFDESRKYLLQLSGSHSATKRINILNGETPVAADWKAQYVKEHHKVLFVLGPVRVKEWKGHSKRVECCRLQMETIVTGSSDGVVRSWSATTLKCLATYVVPNKARIVDLEFDENKKSISGIARKAAFSAIFKDIVSQYTQCAM